jgi:CRISPR-associated protein Cmr2
MSKYTVISFAPVQGFIEKSRKLRDLYGASQILSYLSWKIVCRANSMEGVRVISPADADDANMDIVQGMPNRILLEGSFSYNDAKSVLVKGWSEIVTACRGWIEEQLIEDYNWERAWKQWQINAWEVFWGSGDSIESAMLDLETRKLRRDWTAPNWNGESSSLSGHDAIAYPNMSNPNTVGANRNEGRESEAINRFYEKLAAALENPEQQDEPKFLAPSERLSIPELIKRLVTHHQIAEQIDPRRSLYTRSFREMLRIREKESGGGGYWTGWFMGDGDEVGEHLKRLTSAEEVENFSSFLRAWGKNFQNEFDLGRVVYAGGDDFFGVMYGDEKNPQRSGMEAIDWLLKLRNDWRGGEEGQPEKLGIKLSLGFVWAGHSVPQRDVLQHCREAEKLAKSLGRDRITIRVVFNNGQFVQWTTPWQYLKWLKDYRDRDGTLTYCKNDTDEYELTGKKANWSHVYGDLAQLKARHAIPPEAAENQSDYLAIELLTLYFGEDKRKMFSKAKDRKLLTGERDEKSVIAWIESMILVGWQLCSNS